MKIHKFTLDVLKNFSLINQGILIEPNSSVIKTISPSKNILAKANIDDEFPEEICIYDLPQFLSTLNLFEEPELEFNNENYMIIKESSGFKHSCKFFFASKNMIVYPENDIQMPHSEIKFEFSDEMLKKLEKASSTLGVPDLVVTHENGEIVVQVKDKTNGTSNDFTFPVGDYDGNEDDDFQFHFKVENLKLMKGSYNVEISSKRISRFYNDDLGLEYFIALEATSYANW